MNFKKWRKSASLVIVAKNAISSPSQFNYNLLTMKRSSKTSIHPEVTVFPGGILEKNADTSKEWLNIFDKFGFPFESFVNDNPTSVKPPIFLSENSNEIPRCLSLRITAIRETFEESGILICRDENAHHEDKLHWSNHIILDDVNKWQKRIHNDPMEFLNLCSHFKVYPDVLSLHDWSNWFTPSSVKAKFDTVFFLSAFNKIPPTMAEKGEVMHLQWSSPLDYEEERRTRKIKLLVPQFYEISRLRNFSDVNGLLLFAQDRAQSGLEKFFPFVVSSEKETCMLLPGDDLYPQNYNPDNDEVVELKEITGTQVRHRVCSLPKRIGRIEVQNYKPRFNHVLPITSTTL
ncbi:hypothetical protein FQR65_LT13399 [Abscondita terminalis]|nr:hypothetical protein FQR65_LT13399 [Abscondita terminalis]